MKLPRISVGVLMAALVVIAFDCVIVRSIRARPYDAGLTGIACTTLPMANLLCCGIAWLASGRARPRRFLVGFEVGAWCAMIATIVGIRPTLELLDSASRKAGLGAIGFAESPMREIFAWFVLLGLMPFLFQLLVGLAGGWVAGRFGSRLGPATVVAPSPRLRVRSLLALVVLAAIPAVVVEGVLRWSVDSSITRLAEGSEAVIEFEDPWGLPGGIPAGSPLRQLDQAKVRILKDRDPNSLELLKDDWITLVRDYRSVRVKFLEGPMAGESDELPHFMLRPIR